LVKNDRIEIKCSSEVRVAFEVMATELTAKLRKKLRRRVYAEDIIRSILNAYRTNPNLFEVEWSPPTARIR